MLSVAAEAFLLFWVLIKVGCKYRPFEDPKIAEFLDDYFCIKVDRKE